MAVLLDLFARTVWAGLWHRTCGPHPGLPAGLAPQHKVKQAIIALLRPHKAQCKTLTLTLTFVNGKEFAEQEFTTQCLKAKVYFAHPYRSWERGLNQRPRKCLGYRTPHEVVHCLKMTPLRLPCDALCS